MPHAYVKMDLDFVFQKEKLKEMESIQIVWIKENDRSCEAKKAWFSSFEKNGVQKFGSWNLTLAYLCLFGLFLCQLANYVSSHTHNLIVEVLNWICYRKQLKSMSLICYLAEKYEKSNVHWRTLTVNVTLGRWVLCFDYAKRKRKCCTWKGLW